MSAAGSGAPTIRSRYRAFVARHEVAWELGFAGLALIYVAIGSLPEEVEWALALDWILTLVFALEFGTRLWAAPSRRAYLRGHWIDLVALVPPVRGLRTLRLLRLLRLVRAFAGLARGLAAIERLASHKGLVRLLVAWLGVMVIASIGLYAAEHGVNETIDEPVDALWWGITTMTTVGYGDIYPVTMEGRAAAAALMLLGIGLFSAVTAIVTSFMLEGRNAPDPIDQIRRLSDLRDEGLISDDEFASKRVELLQKL